MRRESSISIKGIKSYKVSLMILLGLLVSMFAVKVIVAFDWLSLVLAVLYPVVLIYYWAPGFLQNLRAIKQISYDEQYLYVHETNADTQIPLERIREVELTTLDGMYKFHLMDKESFGPYILCKTSFWYPFNFKKVDKELDHVRYLINKCKRNSHQEGNNRLPSQTS